MKIRVDDWYVPMPFWPIAWVLMGAQIALQMAARTVNMCLILIAIYPADGER